VQVLRLIDAAKSEMDAAIFTLAPQADPRKSEIRALLVRNVDFQNRLIRFEDGFTNEGGTAGNKARKPRSVPMTEAIVERLRPFCKGKSPDARVFMSECGGPIDDSGLYKRFKAAAKRADLPEIRFHDLRHSFGTQAIQRFDIYSVQRMMGHASITTTEKYLHYRPSPQAADLMDELWTPATEDNVVPLARAA
jgi:integrase